MSNHLGDTNKMVSDTPRTDAAYFKAGATMYDLAGEMKRVERELNAANESFRKLNIHALNLVDRIRRLEEAGDKIVEAGWSVQDWSGMCVVWAKAKEDKL